MSYEFKLKRLCEAHGPQVVSTALSDAFAEGKVGPRDLSVARLREAFLGGDYLTVKGKAECIKRGLIHTREATEAVDLTAFSNITGQLLVTEVKAKYNAPEFIGDKLMRTIPNPGSNMQEHKVPYLSDVDSEPPVLASAEPYPFAKFQEVYVTLPAPEKRGHVCTVTMEMLMGDYTGQAQDSAGSVGRALRYNKEKRQLRVVLGAANNYVFKGASMNTYLSTANATGLYVNRVFSNTIANYNQINTVEQLAWNMTDPITGRVINVRPNSILCMPEKRYDLARILNAVEVRDATTGVHDVSKNPIDTSYSLHTSPIARALLNAGEITAVNSASLIKEYVILADFQRAFVYREVYPLQVEQAPAGNPMEFGQDIVLAVKASEFGVAGVYDPRYAFLSTAEGS
jgi:hypothetical protein